MNEINIGPGDRICLYTDGVTECFNSDEDAFGETRLIESLKRHSALPPDDLKTAVIGDLDRHRGNCPLDDDVTLMIAEIS
jgi:serine phosphatase RsbU (regulator of sigma subunit)